MVLKNIVTLYLITHVCYVIFALPTISVSGHGFMKSVVDDTTLKKAVVMKSHHSRVFFLITFYHSTL